jgi:uncharacterized protein YkwD
MILTSAGRVLALLLPLLLAACQSASLLDLGSGSSVAASREGLEHISQIRSANGLPQMRADRQLEQAARRQAGYMAQARRMAHDTGRGRDFASRMRRDDVRPTAAENIAHGRMPMPQVFSMWMNSEGHRRNMLNPDYGRFGLAYAEGEGGRRYWALVMAP